MKRNLDSANWVMKTDSQIDHVCHAVFRRHLESKDRRRDYSTNLLFMAQAFERAGDHAKNLGEELFHLVEGRSLRHEPKRREFPAVAGDSRLTWVGPKSSDGISFRNGRVPRKRGPRRIPRFARWVSSSLTTPRARNRPKPC